MIIKDVYGYLLAKKRPIPDDPTKVVDEDADDYVLPTIRHFLSYKSRWIRGVSNSGSLKLMYSTRSCIDFLNGKESIVVLKNRTVDAKRFIYDESSGGTYLWEYANTGWKDWDYNGMWDTCLLSEYLNAVLNNQNQFPKEEIAYALYLQSGMRFEGGMNSNELVRIVLGKVEKFFPEELRTSLEYIKRSKEFFKAMQNMDFEYALMKTKSFAVKELSHFGPFGIIKKGFNLTTTYLVPEEKVALSLEKRMVSKVNNHIDSLITSHLKNPLNDIKSVLKLNNKIYENTRNAAKTEHYTKVITNVNTKLNTKTHLKTSEQRKNPKKTNKKYY